MLEGYSHQSVSFPLMFHVCFIDLEIKITYSLLEFFEDRLPEFPYIRPHRDAKNHMQSHYGIQLPYVWNAQGPHGKQFD